MRIESNITQVIERLERLKAAVPMAVSQALAPDRWREPARVVAEQALLQLAQPAERAYIPGFIQTVSAVMLDARGGLALRMAANLNVQVTTLQQAQAVGGVVRSKDLGLGLFDRPYWEVRDIIEKWVQTPEAEGGKARDARDTGKTDEEIASLISFIMLTPTDNLRKDGEAARQALTPHIEAFIASLQPPTLPPETVDLWLRTVLELWRQMIRQHFASAVRDALRGMRI